MKRLWLALVFACGPSAKPAAPVDKPAPANGSAEAAADPDADTDGDGVVDRVDVCPAEVEDFDGVQDTDGCPDPDAKAAP